MIARGTPGLGERDWFTNPARVFEGKLPNSAEMQVAKETLT